MTPSGDAWPQPSPGPQPGQPGASDGQRLEELRANLAAVRARIEQGCAATGRDPAEVTLVVVTKYFPTSDVLLLHRLGVRDFGENRDQEAGEKFRAARHALGEAGEDDLTLHFIGQLQSNKAGHVAGYADVVQSVDRSKIVAALDRGAHAADRRLRLLLQVSLDGDTSRGGVLPQEAAQLAGEVARHELLSLKGVMAVAPLGADPDDAFTRLREVADGIRERHPDADWLSAGMSADLEAGLRHGATHLRVGTAILGSRPSLL